MNQDNNVKAIIKLAMVGVIIIGLIAMFFYGQEQKRLQKICTDDFTALGYSTDDYYCSGSVMKKKYQPTEYDKYIDDMQQQSDEMGEPYR